MKRFVIFWQRDLAAVGIRSLPTTILIGPDGMPAKFFQGYSAAVKESVAVRG